MKSTFKKALAAVSAAAVVATSAAVFTAVPAQAVNTPSIGQVTVTLDELQANNYLVTVPVYIAGNTDGWDSIAFGVQWSTDELTYSKGVAGASVLGAMGEGIQVSGSGFQLNPAGIGGWITYATTPTGDGPTYVTGDGSVLNLTFKVTENAQPGDIYYIDGLERSYDGAYVPKVTHGSEVVTGAPSQGYIQIEGVQTTTTEATTTTTTSKKTEKKTQTQTETVTEPVQEEQPSAPQPAEPTEPDSSTNMSNRNLSAETSEMLGYVNEVRKQYGLRELEGLELLDSAADVRANELLENYSHDRPDGNSYITAIEEPDLPEWRAAAENIAYGMNSMTTVKEAFDAWMNSPPHRENILNPDVRYMACAKSTKSDNGEYTYWEQLFYSDT